jgi:hypothetical protein
VIFATAEFEIGANDVKITASGFTCLRPSKKTSSKSGEGGDAENDFFELWCISDDDVALSHVVLRKSISEIVAGSIYHTCSISVMIYQCIACTVPFDRKCHSTYKAVM